MKEGANVHLVVGVSMLPQATRPPRRSQTQTSSTEASAAPSGDNFTEGDAFQGASKYVEAIRNPDWRRKDGNSQESDFHTTESLGFDRAAHKLSSGQNTDRSGSQGVEDSDSSGSWDPMDFGQPHVAPRQRFDRQPQPRPAPLPPKSYQKNMGTQHHDAPGGFVQLIAPKSIPNAWPMSLMEIRPVSQQEATAQRDKTAFGFVRKMNDELPYTDINRRGKELSDEQSEQFAAALQAVDKTPQKAKRSSQIPIFAHDAHHVNSSSSSRSQHVKLDSYHAELDANLQSAYEQGSAIQPPPPQQNRISIKHPDGSDVKFKKLLERLQSGSKDKTISRESSRFSGVPFQSTQRQLPLPKMAQFSHASSEDNTTGLSTDSIYSNRVNNSRSAGSSEDRTSANATFNPRAQEFLSFSGKENAPEEVDRHSKFDRAIPINELFEKSSKGLQTSEKCRNSSSEADSLSLYDTQTIVYPPNGTLPFCGMPAQGLIPNQQSIGLNLFSNPGPVAPVGMEAAQNPGFLGPGGVQGGLWPRPGPFNFQSMSNSGATITPFQGPWGADAGVGAVAGQKMVGTTQNRHPQPVAKPRRPDPGNQQAYEAWIEWRKANEPGYAMECKLRQQRRSQRNVAAAPKPKIDEPPKLEASTEVAASA